MDDFYAECDEHFGEIRAALIHLEAGLGRQAPDSTTLLRLFRSFHSLKGIFGMAGVQAAEALAHRMEDYLRSLTREQAIFSEEGFDALTSATERLEQIVAAHRQGTATPDISALVDGIGRLIDEPASQVAGPNKALPASVEAKVKEAQGRGLTIWECLFQPSKELSEAGKNVNTARARAEALGEIVHSAPKIEG